METATRISHQPTNLCSRVLASILHLNRLNSLEDLVNALFNLVAHLFALKHERKLLQTPSQCLREQEIYRGDFHQNPHAIDEIVLPSDGVERDGVDVGVEEDGEAHRQLLDGDALGTLLVREDLHHVGVSQGVPANVVEPISLVSSCFYLVRKESYLRRVDEDEYQDRNGRPGALFDVEASRSNSPHCRESC